MQFNSKTVRSAGTIACLAALLGVIADLVLQYTPNTAHLLSHQSFYLLDVSPSRLFLGHYLGIAAILAEIIGFWLIYCALQPAGERFALPFFLISSFGAMLGAAFHSTFIFVGLTLQLQYDQLEGSRQLFTALLANFDKARIGLAIPALLGFVISSLWYAFTVAFKKNLFPRWMALCNPLFFQILIIALYSVFRPLALVLAPIALNLSHLIFFSLTTAVLWKYKERS